MTQNKLIPENFYKAIAVWSLIPSYLIAGGVVGYGLDRWLNTFPFIMCAGMLFAFAMSIRDMFRLRETMF